MYTTDPNYLAHHGILGMKWGVRRYQNEDGTLTNAGKRRHAKDIQKNLNTYDKQLRALTISEANSVLASDKYSKRADKARLKGKNEKAEKLQQKASNSKAMSKEFYQRRQDVGRKYYDEMDKLSSSSLAFKINQVEFTQPAMKYSRISKDIVNKYGKIPWRYSDINAASGNKWKVRDSSQISDKRKQKWNNRHTINTIRPQRVEYIYV